MTRKKKLEFLCDDCLVALQIDFPRENMTSYYLDKCNNCKQIKLVSVNKEYVET